MACSSNVVADRCDGFGAPHGPALRACNARTQCLKLGLGRRDLGARLVVELFGPLAAFDNPQVLFELIDDIEPEQVLDRRADQQG